MKSTWIEQRNQYFQDSFRHYLELWHKENPKKNTQGELARIIRDNREKRIGEKSSVSKTYISEWKHGKWFPELYLEDIAEAFGISVDNLTPSTRAEKYRVSSDYTTELGRKLLDKACTSFGLNIAFLDAVRSLFGDEFKDVFPVWTPIILQNDLIPNINTAIETGSAVQDAYTRAGREGLAEAANAEMQEAGRVQLQVEVKNDLGETEYRTVFLSEVDLIYLKDVQQDVKDYIEFLFMKRKKEMAMEVEECNAAANHVVDGLAHFYLIDPSPFDKYLQKTIQMQPNKQKGESR